MLDITPGKYEFDDERLQAALHTMNPRSTVADDRESGR